MRDDGGDHGDETPEEARLREKDEKEEADERRAAYANRSYARRCVECIWDLQLTCVLCCRQSVCCHPCRRICGILTEDQIFEDTVWKTIRSLETVKVKLQGDLKHVDEECERLHNNHARTMDAVNGLVAQLRMDNRKQHLKMQISDYVQEMHRTSCDLREHTTTRDRVRQQLDDAVVKITQLNDYVANSDYTGAIEAIYHRLGKAQFDRFGSGTAQASRRVRQVMRNIGAFNRRMHDSVHGQKKLGTRQSGYDPTAFVRNAMANVGIDDFYEPDKITHPETAGWTHAGMPAETARAAAGDTATAANRTGNLFLTPLHSEKKEDGDGDGEYDDGDHDMSTQADRPMTPTVAFGHALRAGGSEIDPASDSEEHAQEDVAGVYSEADRAVPLEVQAMV